MLGRRGCPKGGRGPPAAEVCSDMEPRRELASGLDAPEMGPSRMSSLGTAAASYMSSLMLILVSVNDGWRFLGVRARQRRCA